MRGLAGAAVCSAVLNGCNSVRDIAGIGTDTTRGARYLDGAQELPIRRTSLTGRGGGVGEGVEVEQVGLINSRATSGPVDRLDTPC